MKKPVIFLHPSWERDLRLSEPIDHEAYDVRYVGEVARIAEMTFIDEPRRIGPVEIGQATRFSFVQTPFTNSWTPPLPKTRRPPSRTAVSLAVDAAYPSRSASSVGFGW